MNLTKPWSVSPIHDMFGEFLQLPPSSEATSTASPNKPGSARSSRRRSPHSEDAHHANLKFTWGALGGRRDTALANSPSRPESTPRTAAPATELSADATAEPRVFVGGCIRLDTAPLITLPSYPSDAELRSLQVPVVALLGGISTVHNSANAARRLTELIPTAQIHIWPTAGHAPNLECADEVNSRILEFVQ
jgi:pimeloyl-ACP methyl ester carboxylesterase